MTDAASGPSFDSLPATLPIFPLPGALLLPGGKLPLQIFEPRYLAMSRDALSSDRLIGMIQPRDRDSEQEGLVPHGVDLCAVGCAGRIISFSETDDGRHMIVLKGLCRFGILRELPSVDGYRRLVPDFARFRADLEPASGVIADRGRLMSALRSYFTNKGITVDLKAVAELPDEKLVTSLAMACPFEAKERQALLEAPDLGERARVLSTLFELGTFANDGPSVRH